MPSHLCRYTCDEDYEFRDVGDTWTVTCHTNGSWAPTPPSEGCIGMFLYDIAFRERQAGFGLVHTNAFRSAAKTCGEPPSWDHLITQTPEGEILPGQKVEYSCPPNSEYVFNSTLTMGLFSFFSFGPFSQL